MSKTASEIVRKLLLDIDNRSGLQNAMDSIDYRTKKDMKEEWIKIIDKELAKVPPYKSTDENV